MNKINNNNITLMRKQVKIQTILLVKKIHLQNKITILFNKVVKQKLRKKLKKVFSLKTSPNKSKIRSKKQRVVLLELI